MVCEQPRKKSNIIQYVDFWLSFLPQKYSHKFCLFTDHGKVLKTINAASADDSSKVSSVVIEELDVLAKPEPIRNLKIVRTMQYGECIDEEWWIIIFSLFCVLYYGALHQHKFFKKGSWNLGFLNIKLKIIGLSCEPQKRVFDIKMWSISTFNSFNEIILKVF